MSMQALVMSARRKASAWLGKMSERQSALESRLEGASAAAEAPSQPLGEATKAGGEIWRLYRMSRGSDTVSREVMDALAKRPALKG